MAACARAGHTIASPEGAGDLHGVRAAVTSSAAKHCTMTEQHTVFLNKTGQEPPCLGCARRYVTCALCAARLRARHLVERGDIAHTVVVVVVAVCGHLLYYENSAEIKHRVHPYYTVYRSYHHEPQGRGSGLCRETGFSHATPLTHSASHGPRVQCASWLLY